MENKQLPKITDHLKAQVRIWVKALRSGEYDQTQEHLQDAHGYCCLGVACKIFIPKVKLEMADDYMDGGDPTDQKHAPAWLKKIDSDFIARTGMSLMALNDDGVDTDENGKEPLTFDEIADLLEAVYLLGVDATVEIVTKAA